jgi:hypothetical protein
MTKTHRPGDFLKPDEVTFAVLLRGYGLKKPPQWGAIDSTLTRMRARYQLEPTAGEADGRMGGRAGWWGVVD